MHKHNLNPVPTLVLSFHDLAAVRGIIRAYITYTRRVSKPTRKCDEQILVLESLYVRLTNIPVARSWNYVRRHWATTTRAVWSGR